LTEEAMLIILALLQLTTIIALKLESNDVMKFVKAENGKKAN